MNELTTYATTEEAICAAVRSLAYADGKVDCPQEGVTRTILGHLARVRPVDLNWTAMFLPDQPSGEKRISLLTVDRPYLHFGIAMPPDTNDQVMKLVADVALMMMRQLCPDGDRVQKVVGREKLEFKAP